MYVILYKLAEKEDFVGPCGPRTHLSNNLGFSLAERFQSFAGVFAP